jgi:hypothetical protein
MRIGVSGALVGALLLATGCAAPAPNAPPQAAAPAEAEPALDPRGDPEFVRIARQADSVVVAELVRVDFSDPAADKFLTTAEWRSLEVLRGDRRAGETVRVRIPLGQDPDGQWRWIRGETAVSPDATGRMKPGDRFLLKLSRSTYEAQVRARGGEPLPGVTGAGLGLHPLSGREIRAGGSFRPPASLEHLKAQLQD